jgi:LemA protein
MVKLNVAHKVLIGIGVFLVIILLWFVSSYNGLITLSESVDTSWAQVENQYQRRADLIPNLVNTVKGYASHEKELFTEITSLRSQWASATTKTGKISAAKGLDSGLSRLMLVAENYPQLKAGENFLALQTQLEGTENRVAVERKRYNEVVKAYNIKIKRIPTVFIANMFGYSAEEYYEADKGAEVVTKVDFE